MESHQQFLLEKVGQTMPDISYASLFCDSVQMIMIISMEIIIMTINLHYVDGPEQSAGLGLSMVLIHSLGGSIISGFNTGCSNFTSKAFGANNRTLFNRQATKGAVVLVVMLFLFSILGLSSEWLAVAVGQDLAVARSARDFYVYQLPGYLCLYTASFIQGYLNSQSIYQPIQHLNLAGIAIHLALSFLISSHYRSLGVIFCTNLTFLSILLMTIYVQRKHAVWKWEMGQYFDGSWKEDLGYYIQQCFYIGFPLFLDLFMFELLTIYIGSFQLIEQTVAHVNFTNIAMLFSAPMSGISYTSMVKAGQLIGQNDYRTLKTLAWRTLVLCYLAVVPLYLMLYFFSQECFSFYSQDLAVQGSMYTILLPYLFMISFDSVQFTGCQMFKALEMGDYVCKTLFIGYYAGGLGCLAVLNSLMDTKLLCPWWSFACGLAVVDLLFYKKYSKLNLEQAVAILHGKVSMSTSTSESSLEMIGV